MAEVKQFIEDAIEGGYNAPVNWEGMGGEYQLLLSPQVWQAVGKTRGWDEMKMSHYGDRFTHQKRSEIEHYWHRLIDHLADGKTIEEALSAINK